MSYQQFAYVYDQLMTDAPYDGWLQFLDRVVQKYDHPMREVLDLACGTGSISIPLAARGYKVVGIDLSEDMLAVANDKSQQMGLSIEWVNQDMTELELPYQVDTILCFCDSMNYVVEGEQVKQTFQRMYNHLTPGGFLLFDMHSLHKIQHVFGDRVFGTNDQEISLLWQCFYNEESVTVDHELTFFMQEKGTVYKRFDETHTQKGYPMDSVLQWLMECGFEMKEVTADFSENPPGKDSERLFIVAQKNK
jgi:ubiquinone/menaquinone biosynthesis C-methylase UbiE